LLMLQETVPSRSDLLTRVHELELGNKALSSKNEELETRNQNLDSKNQELSTRVEELDLRNKELNLQAEVLTELVCLLRGQRFAPKSEKASPDQLAFGECFNEAEATDTEEETIEVKSHTKKKPGGRNKLPETFPRVQEVIDLEDKTCTKCGSEMSHIGDVVTEKLNLEPLIIEVVERIRRKYACRACEEVVKTAPLPKDPIPKSIATPGLLSFITVSKFVDRLPLYAIEGILQRNGVDIPRNTLSNWMIKSGELVQPLMNLLEERALESGYLKMDETTVQVLKEPGKKATTKSYMWVRWRAGPDPILLFEYDPTRSGAVPKRLLEGFEGFLQVDGYTGYNEVCEWPKITRVGCMAHVRRKFKEAAKSSKKKARANYALKLIGKLYVTEKEIKDLTADEKLSIRQTQSKPVFEELEAWAKDLTPKVAPKTLLGKALQYFLNELENVRVFLNHGHLDIDNNLIENAIRPFAVGRKNWLFSDSVSGARASANLYSLVETAKANGLNPHKYLKYVFTELPKAETIKQIESLLPSYVAKNNALA
jgi:transposase